MATFDDIQRQQAELSQSIGQRYANVPKMVEQYNPVNDPVTRALRNQHSDKVQQLFNYDTQLGQTYFQPQAAPGPTQTGAPAAQPEQMILDPLIGAKAANTQTLGTANEVANLLRDMGSRKDYLDTALTNALKLFQIGIEADKIQQAALEGQFNQQMSLEELGLKKSAAARSGAGTAQTADQQRRKAELLRYLVSGGEGEKITNLEAANAAVGTWLNEHPQDIDIADETAFEFLQTRKGLDKTNEPSIDPVQLGDHRDDVITYIGEEKKAGTDRNVALNLAKLSKQGILNDKEVTQIFDVAWPKPKTEAKKKSSSIDIQKFLDWIGQYSNYGMYSANQQPNKKIVSPI